MLGTFILLAHTYALWADTNDALSRCNVVWEVPSEDSAGSMPIGNGDIGLNVWVEPNGDLLFYISKTDAFSENGQLLKLGRVRIKLVPALLAGNGPFRQELRLREGEIAITSGDENDQTQMRVWVDAHQPVVRIEADTAAPSRMQASLEMWRTEPRTISSKDEQFAIYGLIGSPHPIVVDPDVLLASGANCVTWYHRNERSVFPLVLQNQHLGVLLDKYSDPLLHRTFGCRMTGMDFTARSDSELKSRQPSTHHQLSIYALTKQTETVDGWIEQMDKLAASGEEADLHTARTAHRRWWNAFWKRSWIHVSQQQEDPREVLTHSQVPLRIGADSNGQSKLVGAIARARVWSDAITDAQVAELARAPRQHNVDGPLKPVVDFAFDRMEDGVFPCRAGSGLVARPVGQLSFANTKQGKTLRFDGRGYLEVDNDPRLDLTRSVSLEAWVCPGKTSGRLIDKTPVGTGDGYLLDTWPGNALRSIIKPGTLTYDAQLTPNSWVHVVSTFDAESGLHALYLDGKKVTSRRESVPSSCEAFDVTRGYALTRWMLACAGRGSLPMKFNGSIFTVDAPPDFDADYRAWGGCFWFQNQRLLYWPMLAAGDMDLMQPWFRMYRDLLPMARDRTRLYYDHDGAYFYETMYFWGTANNNNFGWGNPKTETVNTYIRYYWQSGIELTAMMLDYYDITRDGHFAQEILLPVAGSVTTFFDHHYSRDSSGKIRFEPAQALETWQEAVNPTPEIAGLRYVLPRLLELPTALVNEDQRAAWSRLLAELPPVPVKEIDGERRLVPAEMYAREANMEGPELYAVYPYRLYGLGKPDTQVAVNAFHARKHKQRRHCWWQHGIWAAHLGLAEEARHYLLGNFTAFDVRQRFPAFWKPNPDWVPDMDNGGVGMITLQSMLMQTEGRAIRLLPAWPDHWDVHFKLHAPGQTTVECQYRDGKVQSLVVAPEYRRKDVLFPTTTLTETE